MCFWLSKRKEFVCVTEGEWEEKRERVREGMGGAESGLDLWMQSCVYVCVGVSHLALSLIPPPSPPHPPGHRFSAAGSAGDTHQTPVPPFARSSWPETVREDADKKVCVRVRVFVGVLREEQGRGRQQQEHSKGGCKNEGTQQGRK